MLADCGLVWRTLLATIVTCPMGIDSRCPKRVKSDGSAMSALLPLHPPKPTFIVRFGMSVWCPLGDITCRYNHPSGDPTLSQAEIRMTKAIIDIASPCTITSSSARTGMPA